MNKYQKILILSIVFAATLFVLVHLIPENEYYKGSDEGYYFHYAQYVSKNGIASISDLIHWYSSTPSARLHPAPSRVGGVLLNATCFKIFGASYSILGAISFFSFLAFLYLAFYFCRKHFGIDKALIFLLFLASSPLLLGMSRRALSDSLINLLWGAIAWVYFDFIKFKSKTSYIILLILLPLAISIKESSIVLLLFCGLFAGIYNWVYNGKLKWSYILGLFTGTLTILGAVYIFVLGPTNMMVGIHSIFVSHFKDALRENPYAILYASGPWFRYIIDFMLLSPLITLLFIGYVFHIVSKRLFTWEISFFLIYFCTLYGALGLMPHRKLIRFITNGDMVLNLFAVFMLFEIFRSKDEKLMYSRILAVAVIIFFSNYTNFISMFIHGGLLDPTSYHLLMLRGMIPQM